MRYTVTVDGDVFEIEVDSDGRAWVNRQPHEVDLRRVGGNGSTQSPGEYSLLLDNRSFEVHVEDSDSGQGWVMVGGRPYRTRLRRGHGDGCQPGRGGNGRAGAAGGGCGAQEGFAAQVEVRAPLPGLLVGLQVSEGERVEEQQVVAVLESMKMNLELRAPRDGVVRELCVAPGRQVTQDEVLVVLGSNGTSSGDQFVASE